MVVLVSRIVCALVLGVLGYQLTVSGLLSEQLSGLAGLLVDAGMLVVVGAGGGWLLGGPLGRGARRALHAVEERTVHRPGSELVVGAIGLVFGLAVSALLSIPVSKLEPVGSYLVIPMALVIAYVSVELAMSRHRDVLRLFGVRIDGDAARAKILDASSLVDGRVADIIDAGFLEGRLVVPMFVLDEMQRIADSEDDVRRARGRRGLEVVARLRKARRISTIDEHPDMVDGLDAKVVRIAARHGWVLVTNDAGAAKLAASQSVSVRNINELANALKPEFVPGEQFELLVVREGKEEGQGVGYLDDGTMVVVDQGVDVMGETVDVEVSTMLQSPTGKIVFARRSGIQ